MTTPPSRMAFVGPAGTGKTHSLIEAVQEAACSRDWAEHEALLALTFMHGSRRRLQQRLKPLIREGVAVNCSTIDSFALGLVRRFRRYLGLKGSVVISDGVADGWGDSPHEHRGSFDLVRRATIELLTMAPVRSTVRNAFPILVVDEFQDCADATLDIIRALSELSETYLAADPFQTLDITPGTAAVSWMEASCDLRRLDKVRRTDCSKLLAAGQALRSGVPANTGIEVIFAKGPGLAAWEIATRLKWTKGWHPANTIILSPTGPGTAPFVKNTLLSLGKPLGKAKNVGPYPFEWLGSSDDLVNSICAGLALGDSSLPVRDLDALSKDPLLVNALKSVRRQQALRGRTDIGPEELIAMVRRHVRDELNYGGLGLRHGRTAMTIASAKNREFENVAILWPNQIKNDSEYRRRLLYNAITRAKRNAIVLVEGGSNRLNSDGALPLITTAN